MSVCRVHRRPRNRQRSRSGSGWRRSRWRGAQRHKQGRGPRNRRRSRSGSGWHRSRWRGVLRHKQSKVRHNRRRSRSGSGWRRSRWRGVRRHKQSKVRRNRRRSRSDSGWRRSRRRGLRRHKQGRVRRNRRRFRPGFGRRRSRWRRSRHTRHRSNRPVLQCRRRGGAARSRSERSHQSATTARVRAARTYRRGSSNGSPHGQCEPPQTSRQSVTATIPGEPSTTCSGSAPLLEARCRRELLAAGVALARRASPPNGNADAPTP
jgi:hypothetical protein